MKILTSIIKAEIVEIRFVRFSLLNKYPTFEDFNSLYHEMCIFTAETVSDYELMDSAIEVWF